jgi:hypothetical protein
MILVAAAGIAVNVAASWVLAGRPVPAGPRYRGRQPGNSAHSHGLPRSEVKGRVRRRRPVVEHRVDEQLPRHRRALPVAAQDGDAGGEPGGPLRSNAAARTAATWASSVKVISVLALYFAPGGGSISVL